MAPMINVGDNELSDETLIYFYKDSPVYVDFLFLNENTNNYFEKMKDQLTLRKCESNFFIM